MEYTILRLKKNWKFENQRLAQLSHFTGGEIKAQREAPDAGPQRVRGWPELCSPGTVCLSVCCFCSDTVLSPQSRNLLVLASGASLI